MLDTQTAVTEKSFDTGEITLNYAESGAGALAPLVLLHGGTRWWQDWNAIIPQFAPSRTVYAPDLRGHGKSGRDGDHYLLPDYARDIVAFLKGRVDKPSVVVGHSLGAMTTIGTAAAAPDAVKAVVLVDPPLFIRDHGIEFMPDIHGWLTMVHQLTSAATSYDDMVERCRPLAGDHGEDMLRVFARNLYGIAPETAALFLQNRMLENFDLTQNLARIACPTLLLMGEYECGAVMRDEDAAYARATIPNVKIVKLETSHQVVAEAPDALVREIQIFLNENNIA